MYWSTSFGLLNRFLLGVRLPRYKVWVPDPRKLSLDWEIHDYITVTKFVNGLRYYAIYAIEAHVGAIDQEWEGEVRVFVFLVFFDVSIWWKS